LNRLPPPELPGWLDALVPFTRYRVEVEPGLSVHVMEQGEGRPVVLLHGNPTWGFLYRKVAAELRGEGFRLIMPDLVGLGFSDRPAAVEEHSLENHSRWMAALLELLEVEDAIAVVQDWGGPIGIHAFSRLPGRMTAMVVMNTLLAPPKFGFKPTTFHRVFSTRFGNWLSRYAGLPQRGLRFAQGDRKSISGEVAKAYAFPLSRQRGNEAVAALVRMVPDDMEHPTVALQGEVRDYLMRFGGPAALVWGSRDPVLGRLARRHQRMLPEARVTITDAGHFLQEEVPGEIADAIRFVAGES
jgi:cis-3-alkyl-4-acyloxetan-2-one decarboxylase